jgi:2-keto-4-pentenoate hydratase
MSGQARNRARLAGVALAGVFLAGCASTPLDVPGCPTGAQIDELVKRYIARQPAPNPALGMSPEAAACGRQRFTDRLDLHLGRVVGYKAALTSAALQKRFNATSPVRGTLFEKMIVPDGASVPASFGARPMFEADLVVVVRDGGIHGALTPHDVMEHISAIRPFIELPDLVVQDPSKFDAGALAAVNAAARMGVLGAPIPVNGPSPALADALRDMTVRLVDADTGETLDTGRGSATLDHPLNAVMWLAADLRRSGITLKPGDLLSVGSFTKLVPPRPGMSVKAIYEGLPGNPSVSVSFR